MRYTHFGIGHSATLRRVIRDSLGSPLVAGFDTMNDAIIEEGAASDDEGDYGVEGLEECDDEQEDDDVEDFDSDSDGCDDDLSDGELDDEDREGCADEFDDVSF